MLAITGKLKNSFKQIADESKLRIPAIVSAALKPNRRGEMTIVFAEWVATFPM